MFAPELDVATRVAPGTGISSFEIQPDSLDLAFSGALQIPAAEPVALDGRNASAWLESARTSLGQGQLEKATEDAQRAERAGADHNQIHLLQGEIYLRRGLAGEAVERFNAVLAEVNSQDAGSSAVTLTLLRQALRGAALCYLELGALDVPSRRPSG